MAGVERLGTYVPKHVQAGEYPVVTESGTIKAGEAVVELSPVVLTAEGLALATSATASTVYGLAASDADEDGNVVVYLTGEFFADALVYPKDTTAVTFKEAFRKLGIFLR